MKTKVIANNILVIANTLQIIKVNATKFKEVI